MSFVYIIFLYWIEIGMLVKICLFKRLKDDCVKKVYVYSIEICFLLKKFLIFLICVVCDL